MFASMYSVRRNWAPLPSYTPCWQERRTSSISSSVARLKSVSPVQMTHGRLKRLPLSVCRRSNDVSCLSGVISRPLLSSSGLRQFINCLDYLLSTPLIATMRPMLYLARQLPSFKRR